MIVSKEEHAKAARFSLEIVEDDLLMMIFIILFYFVFVPRDCRERETDREREIFDMFRVRVLGWAFGGARVGDSQAKRKGL